MQRAPVVALGEKDRKQPSLGQRMADHFHNNRALYGSLAAAGVGAAGVVGGAAVGHAMGHQSGLEKGWEHGAKATLWAMRGRK